MAGVFRYFNPVYIGRNQAPAEPHLFRREAGGFLARGKTRSNRRFPVLEEGRLRSVPSMTAAGAPPR
jgi:hypothetical protein